MASTPSSETRPAVSEDPAFVEQVSIVVDDHDPAIAFFVGALGFDLVEETPSTSTGDDSKRWVVVRPPGGQTERALRAGHLLSHHRRQRVESRLGF